MRVRMISMCFTWFPISGLGKPKLYQNLVGITRKWGFYLVGSDFLNCGIKIW